MSDVSQLERDDIILEIFRNRSEMEARIILRETGEIIDRIPVQWKSRENKLDYLSVSKIQAYEQCPACFYKQYMSDETAHVDNSNYFTKFGSIAHEVCEIMMKRYRNCGIVSNYIEILDEVWKNQDLTGFDIYNELKSILGTYFKNNPVDRRVDTPVLIEEEWRGELGGVTFGLMIDYAGVMRNDPTKGLLRDYKTNRMPFTAADLENSLQLRIYELVLRRHYLPDVTKWTAGYDLFYHGWQQCPDWSEDDLLSAEEYVANVAHQISMDNVWEEKLNPYCGYRECRHTCEKYQNFIKNPSSAISGIITDNMDITAVENARESMATFEKICKNHKDELAGAVKIEIEEAMKRGEKLVIDGQELSLYSKPTSSYKYDDVKNVLLVENKLGLLDGCLSIAKTKFDKAISGDPNLKLTLAPCMQTSYASPYIVKKKAK